MLQEDILTFVIECEQKMLAFKNVLKVDQNALPGLAEHCKDLFLTYRLVGARNLEVLWEIKTFGMPGDI